jgi:hypothetical protein
MIYKNTASQKIAVFAYTAATGAAKTGDAAQITAYISKDWGGAAAITDTNPTELDATNMKGWYVFDLSQAETNAEVLTIAPVSSTSGVVLDQVQVFTQYASISTLATPTNITAAAGITLADDAITAGKFDETTAFPLKAEDANSTYVARTGADSDTLETISDQIDGVSSQVSGIGSGTGAALNFAPTTDSGKEAPATLNGVTKVGTVPTADEYLKTTADNAVYEVITAASTNIDWVYKYSVGSGRVGSKVTFNGYLLVGSPVGTKVVNVYAYNWTGTPAWDLVSVIAGQVGTTDITRDITLLAAHTGTGANSGIIYLRFTNAGAVTSLNVDQLVAQAQNLGQNAGYTGGYVYLDTTGGGTSGTTPFVNGIESNPCTTIAEAYSIATAVGLKGIYMSPGSSVTLTQSAAKWKFYGGTIALSSQSIADAVFEGCYTVSGVSSGDDYKMIECGVGAMTGEHGYFWDCGFKGTFTMLTGGQAYYLHGCFDATNAATACVFVFAANAEFMARDWRGGIQLNSMAATNTGIIDGAGRVVIDASSTAGDLTIRGHFAEPTGITAFLVAGGTLTDSSR